MRFPEFFARFSSRRARKPAGSPDRDQFAQLVLEGMRRAGEKGEITYDPGQFRLLNRGGRNANQLLLGNVYAEYCGAAATEREAIVKRIVRTWFAAQKTIPDDFHDARHDLLPIVRARAYFELAALLLDIESDNPAPIAYQPLGEDLALGLVYDLPEAMCSIRQEDLERWNVTLYEALEAARENLHALPCRFIGPETGTGVYLSVTSDNYDASRLLLVDTIRQFHVQGDFVAMVPNRDSLIVAGSEDRDTLGAMLALAKDALRQPRIISATALRLDGDEWVAWLPDASHPLHEEFRLMAIRSRAQDYREQKDLLDRLHAKRSQDVLVAEYMGVVNNETGDLCTQCVWAKDVPTLLPRTDRIVFARLGQPSAAVAWDRAVEVVGDLMEAVDVYPERFRVSDFPTEDQLKAMGAETT